MYASTEDQSQDSAESFPDIFQTAPFAIYEIDYTVPRFMRVNKVACELSGYTEEEFLSLNPVTWLDPESSERFKERIRRGLAGQRIDETVEFKLKAKDGHDIWATLNVKPTYKKGKLVSALVVGHDITERKKAEQALRDSEENYKFLLHNAPIAIYEIDFEGQHFKSFNDGLCILSGFSREELLTKKPSDLLDAESQEMFRNRIQKTLAGEKIDENIEYRGLRKDGTKIWVTIKVKLSSEKKKFDSALAVAHDITELKETRDKLEEYGKDMERLVEERTKQLNDAERLAAIGATAGMVGHDIRNPLQAITSDIYLAKMSLATLPECEEKKDLQGSILEIEENTFYINKIIDDLQDFARPLTPKIEETDIEGTIASVIATLVKPENVTVEYSIGKDFPKLKTEPTYIKRIITNLANNAIQAMPHGGKVTITAVLKDSKAVIIVEDTGTGIPETVRSKIFTPLVTTKSKGQGFGLSVVKRFTNALGGTVMFETEVQKGTKFTVSLPLIH
jgi:PAS domain S-box-containing protein